MNDLFYLPCSLAHCSGVSVFCEKACSWVISSARIWLTARVSVGVDH
jgi:hypothetical protein